MEDTLRYFFSAIFQGIAAILTLGAMFYMNYQERSRSRIKELSDEVRTFFSVHIERTTEELRMNPVELMISRQKLPRYDHENYENHNLIADEFLEIVNKLNLIKEIIPPLIFQGIVLLVVSSISLFAVGYSDIGNKITFCFGIFILFIMSAFLKNLIAMLRITTGIGSLKLKGLYYVYKRNTK